MRDAVIRGGEAQSGEQLKVGEWKMFAWLERAAIWAVRPVEVTSGLDTFLLEERGFQDLRDVSELITCAICDPYAENETVTDSWETFSAGFSGSSVIFTTFLWLNWDALLRSEAWGGAEAPSRSQVLAAIRKSLAAGIARAREQKLFRGPVRLLLSASVGDCELVLYGCVQDSRDLDLCLYMLTQMGSDVLALDTFGPAAARAARPWPVFRSSRTEVALELDEYLKMLRIARGSLAPVDSELVLGTHPFAGELFPEVGLTRGRGPIPQLEGRLARVAGDGWQDRAVFGREDFIVGSQKGRSFRETIELLTRLDAAAGDDPAFPRRSSIRLGIGSIAHDAKPLTRNDLFGKAVASATEASPRIDDHILNGELDIEPIKNLLVQLRTVGWREDLRIIERMTERCATLLRSPDTRRETRCILRAVLARLTAMCRRLANLEKASLTELPDDGDEHTLLEAQAMVARRVQVLRNELLHSGMSLDRVLSHHSKGAVSLLLHPASQARGAEHIGSEIGLSTGFGVLFRAPALRIQEKIRASGPLGDSQEGWRRELDAKLDEVAMPIIYASQDPDFYIRPELTLLRVPRWTLWYPAAAAHLIHELGHSLAVTGSLNYLLGRILERLHFRKARPRPTSRVCQFFEEALRTLGLPEDKDELHTRPAAIGKLASRFFKADPSTCETLGPDPERLRELEEIVCDVVARVFSYGDDASDDRRQLWDGFDYIAPFTARNDSEASHLRLLRLLSAHIAVCQLRTIRQKGLQPLARDGRRALWEITLTATSSFQQYLAQWAEDFDQRKEHRTLPPACYDAIVSLPSQFAAEIASDGGRGIFRGYQLAAHLIAVVFSFPPLPLTKHQSLFKSTVLWSSVIGAAWDFAANREADTEIVNSLNRGQVPGRPCQHPQRLPRAVAWSHRPETRREIPAQVRLALSFYLADLSHL